MVDLVNCQLRPIVEADLELVLKWRNSERIREVSFSDHLITFEEHLAWFERLQNNQSTQALVFELEGRPVGLVTVHRIDRSDNRCYWGFYLGETGLPAGTGTALGFLGLNHIFENLKMRKLCSEIFSFNIASINFHQRLGFKEEGRLIRHVIKNNHEEDVICMAIFGEDWQEQQIKLGKMLKGDEDVHE